MRLIATSTGSYPPLSKNDTYQNSIKRAIYDQIEAGLDLLSDGQVRSDIAGIFATGIPGIGKPTSGRYPIEDKIEPPDNLITVGDYKLAKEFAKEKPIKAHLTGPTFLSQSLEITPRSPYKSNTDPSLLMDIAKVLINEAKGLKDAGADYIQIDEPTFAYGTISKAGIDAVEVLANEIKFPVLHVCGDVRNIFGQLLNIQGIQILNIEGQFLRKIDGVDAKNLKKSRKMIAYGCVPVNINKIESDRRLKREIIETIDLYGEENVWGITPNCGLRLIESDIISQKNRLAFRVLERLASVARYVENFILTRGDYQNEQ